MNVKLNGNILYILCHEYRNLEVNIRFLQFLYIGNR